MTTWPRLEFGNDVAKTKNRWWTADLHLGHEKTCTTFKRPDGSPLRPFANADEMDRELIARWNARVADDDRVYVLGDVVINRKFLSKLAALRGKKTLVKGNHDIFALSDYTAFFERIDGCIVWDKFVATHVPIHPDSLARFRGNVHGHLHANQVEEYDGSPACDYLCVSVEHTDFAPISHAELVTRFEARQAWRARNKLKRKVVSRSAKRVADEVL